MEIENKWQTLLKIIDWVKFSDTKAVVVITVYGLIIGFYIDSGFTEISLSIFQKIFFILCLTTSILSILFSFLALNPTLKNINKKHSLFFGNIAQFESFNEFKNDYKKIFNNEKIMSNQLSEQIYSNSKIAWKKFKLVSYSIRLMFLSFILIIFLTTSILDIL